MTKVPVAGISAAIDIVLAVLTVDIITAVVVRVVAETDTVVPAIVIAALTAISDVNEVAVVVSSVKHTWISRINPCELNQLSLGHHLRN